MILLKRGLIIVCMQYLSHDSFCFIQKKRIKTLFQNVSLCHPILRHSLVICAPLWIVPSQPLGMSFDNRDDGSRIP